MKIKKYCMNLLRNKLVLKLLKRTSLKNILPDKIYLQMKYKRDYGRVLDWENPKCFDEKMQWLKLYYRKPILSKLVDKYEIKQYVSEKIGKEYIVPTLGLWNTFDEIDFTKLPNQFVLKCTHDSGGLIICRDKKQLNYEFARQKINKCLKKDFYYLMREWPYKNVKHRIIAEQFMSDKKHTDLIDYKFFCFNGKPQYCQVITNRNTEEAIDFFDTNWIHQEFVGLNPKCQNNPQYKDIIKPENYDKMLELSQILAGDFPFVRIDFYNINGNIYFGEMTFFPAGGFGIFTPDTWNYKLGEMITLPPKETK